MISRGYKARKPGESLGFWVRWVRSVPPKLLVSLPFPLAYSLAIPPRYARKYNCLLFLPYCVSPWKHYSFCHCQKSKKKPCRINHLGWPYRV